MMTYEKPWAEIIKFETERIMDVEIGDDDFSFDEGVDDDW